MKLWPAKVLKVLDVFSGIGGFSLGLHRAGMKTIAFCEIEKFPCKVLRKNFPGVPIAGDIRKLTYNKKTQQLWFKTKVIYVGPIDVICGGYPCQPFSVAGKQDGENDDRHLWPEYYRLIRETGTRWVLGENVTGHINLGLDTVLFDLESAGYNWESFIIPACAIGVRHRRDRLWIMAHTQHSSIQRGKAAAQEGQQQPRKEQLPGFLLPGSQPSVSIARTFRNPHGLPNRMDRNKALGNAVVPQIPQILGMCIMNIENNRATL